MTFARHAATLLATLVAALAVPAHARTPPPPSFVFSGLVADDQGDVVVGSTDGALYRRGPDEQRWTRVLPLKSAFTFVLFDAGPAGLLARAQDPAAREPANAASAWQSTDGGRHWTPVPPHHWIARDWPRKVLACDDGRTLIGSYDGGLTWTPYGAPPQGCAQGAAMNSGWVYAMGGGRLSRHGIDASPWVALSAPPGAYRIEIAADGRLVVAARDTRTHRESVWRSTDAGQTWKPMDFRQKGWTGSTRLVAVHDEAVLVALDDFQPFASRVCLARDHSPTCCADLDIRPDGWDRDVLLRGDTLFGLTEYDVRQMKVGTQGWHPFAPAGQAGLPDTFTGKPRDR